MPCISPLELLTALKGLPADTGTPSGAPLAALIERRQLSLCRACSSFAICVGCAAQGRFPWHAHECAVLTALPDKTRAGDTSVTRFLLRSPPGPKPALPELWQSVTRFHVAQRGSTRVVTAATACGRYKSTLEHGDWTEEKESISLVRTLQANAVPVPQIDRLAAVTGLDAQTVCSLHLGSPRRSQGETRCLR